MTSIFKVRRIALKAKLNSISCCLLIKLPQLWISKSHQHWLPFMCAWKVRCSRFVCKHWLQPCLSLSCWAALAIYTWAPRALLHHLLPLGHAWHVPGCRAGCSRATPAWQQQMSGGSFPPYVVSFNMLEAEVCLFPDCVLWELACAQLSPLWWPMTDETRSHYFSHLFLNSATLCRHTSPPGLLRNICTLFFRHRLSILHLCLVLFYTVFLFSAALMVCTLKPSVFSPWKRLGDLQ